MGFWIPNGSKINLKQKRNFYPTRKHSCRQEVDLALVDGNSTNRQMMGALIGLRSLCVCNQRMYAEIRADVIDQLLMYKSIRKAMAS